MARTKMRGLEETKATLRRVPVEVKAKLRTQIFEAAADLVIGIRRAVPVDTGTLRDTIGVAPGRHELQVRVVAGGAATTKKVRKGVKASHFAIALRTGGKAGGSFDYSRGVEFGHVTTGGQHVPAHPYFFTTYRRKKKDIRRKMKTATAIAAKRAFPTVNR